MDEYIKYGDMYYDRYLVSMNKVYLVEAMKYFEKALPNPIAKLRLYIIYKLLDEEAKAQEIYDQLNDSQQRYVDALLIYPTNPEKALNLLEGEADFPEYYLLKVTILLYMGKFYEVLSLLESIKGKFPDEYILPILNTLKKFADAQDLTMQHILLDKEGNIIEVEEYTVEDGIDMLKEIWVSDTPEGYILILPKDKELKQIALSYLYHSHVPIARDILLKLKWNG